MILRDANTQILSLSAAVPLRARTQPLARTKPDATNANLENNTRIIGQLERILSEFTARTTRPLSEKDQFNVRIEKFRVSRHATLTSAHTQIKDSLSRINALTQERLPALRERIQQGPQAAARFDQERISLIAFARGLPLINETLISGTSDEIAPLSMARKRVYTIDDPKRLPKAVSPESPFNRFNAERDVILAQRRVDKEIEETLPKAIVAFQQALDKLEKQITNTPEILPIRPARFVFPYETAQEFYDDFKKDVSLITTEGTAAYRDNLQILGESLFFGAPRGGYGTRLL